MLKNRLHRDPLNAIFFYLTRDICFADGINSFEFTLKGPQRTADVVSIYTMVYNLSIAYHKLRCSISWALAALTTTV